MHPVFDALQPRDEADRPTVDSIRQRAPRTRSMRRSARVCALVGLIVTCAATHARGTGVSAPMTVTVTVVRACAIDTGAERRLLTLTCASGVTHVTVAGDGLAPEVRALAAAGQHVQLTYPISRRMTTETQDAGRPRQVTVNF